jgi:O-antigen ligase
MVNRTTFASDGSTRAVLPFHDGPAPLSEYTLILIPLALFGAYVGKLVSPKIALILTALMFTTMYGSSSRLAIAGILVAISLGSLVFSRRVLLATVASLGVLLGMILTFPGLFPEDLVARVTDFSTMYGTRYSSAEQRFDIWRVALEVWSGNRVLGVGLTGFPVADNQYIRALVELGVVGLLILFLCMLQFVLIGWALYWSAKLSGSKMYQAVGIAYLSSLLALFFYAVSLDAFQPIRPMNVFWFYTGVIFAAARIQRRRAVKPRQGAVVLRRGPLASRMPVRVPA